jgi:hypothetical protein
VVPVYKELLSLVSKLDCFSVSPSISFIFG